MAKTAKTKWILTTSGERSLKTVAKEVASAGLKVEQISGEIGVLVASGTASAAKKARSIKGVADVSPDTSIDIGPPDSPVQ